MPPRTSSFIVGSEPSIGVLGQGAFATGHRTARLLTVASDSAVLRMKSLSCCSCCSSLTSAIPCPPSPLKRVRLLGVQRPDDRCQPRKRALVTAGHGGSALKKGSLPIVPYMLG